jgi:hypothetical protein
MNEKKKDKKELTPKDKGVREDKFTEKEFLKALDAVILQKKSPDQEKSKTSG